MRATWPGARSGRISITTLPLVVSRIMVSSGFAIASSFRLPVMNADRLARPLGLEGGFLDVVETRKFARQILVAFGLDAPLIGTAAARCTLAVFGIKGIHDVHAGDDATERRKTHAVERGVVTEVDEHLAGAGVGTGHGVGDVAA